MLSSSDQAVVDSDNELTELIRNNCDHPMASGGKDADGSRGAVVDQHCRVRGIEGLRVVDASVMPNIVRANTNLTCIMIGERVADWMCNWDCRGLRKCPDTAGRGEPPPPLLPKILIRRFRAYCVRRGGADDLVRVCP